MDIKEIIDESREVADIIADLKKKTVRVPLWADLKKQYYTKYHPVMNKAKYRDKPASGKRAEEKMSRITRGWQKLAVKRMSGLAFGIPVKRIYKPQNEQEEQVANLMEAIFKKNRIDSVNRERAKELYSACEFVTIWYTQKKEAIYAGIPSAYKLRCKTYSPRNNTGLYPLFDEYDDLIALSVEYSRTDGAITTHYFETFTDTLHIRWAATNGQAYIEELKEEIKIGKIPAIYMHREEPIWEDESENVYEAEWALSRNGNYLRKNARPNWVVYCDEKIQKSGINKDDDGVGYLQYPANAKAGYETWSQATDSLKYHVDSIKENFFMQLQLPDLSYENMKTGAMSGESRKMMLIDAQQKVLDESGAWNEAFDREINVIRELMVTMFPALETAIRSLQVECEMTPFQINDEAETIANLTNATGGKAIMSQRTAIANLGYVDNVDEELEQIDSEGTLDVMQQPMM